MLSKGIEAHAFSQFILAAADYLLSKDSLRRAAAQFRVGDLQCIVERIIPSCHLPRASGSPPVRALFTRVNILSEWPVFLVGMSRRISSASLPANLT